MISTIASSVGSALNSALDWIKSRLNNIDIFDEHYQKMKLKQILSMP